MFLKPTAGPNLKGSVPQIAVCLLFLAAQTPLAPALGNDVVFSPGRPSRPSTKLSLPSVPPPPNGGAISQKDQRSDSGTIKPKSLVTTSWPGLVSDQIYEPPDPHGAAGPNGIIQVL